MDRTHQTSGIALPPAKRQRLSPGPSSLGHPTHYGQHGQPLPTYNASAPFVNAPYAPSPSAPGQYMSQPPYDNYMYSFNQPAPVQQPLHVEGPPRNSTGTMGPPEKPKAEKATDINDLNDMVTASGIDLREEENYLAATYRNKHTEPSFNDSFGNSQSTILSVNTSFNHWSQERYGSHPGFQPHGPLSQPAVSQKSVEEILKEKHRLAVRQFNERKQKHLHDPFLSTGPVRDKLQRKTLEYQVRLDLKGYYEQPSQKPAQTLQNVHATTMVGADGTGVIAARADGMLEQGVPLVDLLSLLSLAANERLRGLLEDAHAISRARQFGSQGVVPPEWAGIAQGSGKLQMAEARSQSISRTAWDQVPDSAVSPMTVFSPKLNPTGSTRLMTPPHEAELPPKPTIAFSSPLPILLKSIANADKEAEKKRLERRKKREKERQTSMLSDTASPNTATPTGPGTPGAESAVKITKKQAAKESKQAVTEEVQRKQANATAAMALGSRKYAWMSAATPKAKGGLQAGVGLGRSGTPGTNKTGNAAPAQPQEDVGLRSKEYYKKLGLWREDGSTGRGIQIRDWITVLERDGVEKKTLAKSYARLSSGDKER